MTVVKTKINPPAAVEKVNGVFRLQLDTTSARGKHTSDLALLANGGLKVDDLATIVGRLMERVKELEE